MLRLQTEIWIEQGEARGRALERKSLTYEYASAGNLPPEKGGKAS